MQTNWVSFKMGKNIIFDRMVPKRSNAAELMFETLKLIERRPIERVSIKRWMIDWHGTAGCYVLYAISIKNAYVSINGQTKGCWIFKLMDRRMDRWTDRWIDGCEQNLVLGTDMFSLKNYLSSSIFFSRGNI